MRYCAYICMFVLVSVQLTKCVPTGDLEETLSTADRQIVFQFEPPVHPFIGREPELSTIRLLIYDKKYTVITGPRGIGKSELARKFAEQFKDEYTASILWINCDSITDMVGDFKKIAGELGISSSDKKVTAIIREVFDHFKTKRSMFIFDNAKSDNILLKSLSSFTGDSSKISVVITSRDANWNSKAFTDLPLGNFSKAESVKFIKIALKDLDIPTDETICETLAEHLQYLPLALKKSTEHIVKQNGRGTRYTIDDFIRQLNGDELPVPVTTPVMIEDDIEKDLAQKIAEETAKIGDKIATGATDAWEKVSSGATVVGSHISHGAHVAGKEISSAAKSAASEVKKFFSGFG